jgi:hypothetical protein
MNKTKHDFIAVRITQFLLLEPVAAGLAASQPILLPWMSTTDFELLHNASGAADDRST